MCHLIQDLNQVESTQIIKFDSWLTTKLYESLLLIEYKIIDTCEIYQFMYIVYP